MSMKAKEEYENIRRLLVLIRPEENDNDATKSIDETVQVIDELLVLHEMRVESIDNLRERVVGIPSSEENCDQLHDEMKKYVDLIDKSNREHVRLRGKLQAIKAVVSGYLDDPKLVG